MGWPFHGQALMLEVIQNLLVLQDCDRKLLQLQDELAHIAPQRERLAGQAQGAQARLDHARQQLKGLETQRKELELEVEAIKQRIERYALQQFQTKKNEEYRALAHEIDLCKAEIVKIEDRELDLMERAETVQKQVVTSTKEAAESKKLAEERAATLADREGNLKRELTDLEAKRSALADAVPEPVRTRYERMLKQRGGTVIMGIENGVCGGCHMILQRAIVVACRAEQEVVYCPNCGRMLYSTPDMDVALKE